MQDCLPADAAHCGYRHISQEAFTRALREWEQRRGLTRTIRRAWTSTQPKPEPEPKPKQTREQMLERKRNRARQRWAEMTEEQKAKETARIKAWKLANKQP